MTILGVAMMSSKIRKVKGILFIGDPHLSSRRPGRRKDDDFGKTVLGKIEYLINYCNENKLLPCFLGDMFDSPLEKEEQLKTKLVRTLRRSWTTPIANAGNHDMRNTTLSDGDSLAYLAETGIVNVCETSGSFETVMVGDKLVGIGATPYGQSFPLDARPYFGTVDTIIWLTHHDIAFEGAYPGAMAAQAITGCKLVVNGHMHLRKNVVNVNGTVWFNPGNITRQAIDAIDHEPAAYALMEQGNLVKVNIPHEKAVFDLTGKLIDAISPGEVRRESAEEGDQESAFVNLLKRDTSMEMSKSDDGSILLEDIHSKFERESIKEEVQDLILELHGKAIA